MLVIGLTGSIAMGKSFIAKQCRNFGIQTYDADEIVSNMLNNDHEVIQQIITLIPEANDNKGINRHALAQIVFNDKNKLNDLESIIHPKVKQTLLNIIKENQQKNVKAIILEISLLYEQSYEQYCDYVILASSSKETQEKRVLLRPNMTKEKFNSIVQNQLHDTEKRKKNNIIINTDTSESQTILQLKDFLQKIGYF